jgi:hypothetical protein
MYYISIDQLLGLKKIISINYLAALNKFSLPNGAKKRLIIPMRKKKQPKKSSLFQRSLLYLFSLWKNLSSSFVHNF